jgi:hypothetical protein
MDLVTVPKCQKYSRVTKRRYERNRIARNNREPLISWFL